ncbi:MAG: nuclear transport factor 2 family protein [Iodobacter sp.]
MLKRALIPAALILLSSHAFATPAEDSRAHFQSIASGNVAHLMQNYAEQAQFNWVGGPIDGLYAGKQPINTVWSKFTQAQGTQKVSIEKLEESLNPKGATVTANVFFEGKIKIKVRYVLTWREGKIVNETWQIDPQLSFN